MTVILTCGFDVMLNNPQDLGWTPIGTPGTSSVQGRDGYGNAVNLYYENGPGSAGYKTQFQKSTKTTSFGVAFKINKLFGTLPSAFSYVITVNTVMLRITQLGELQAYCFGDLLGSSPPGSINPNEWNYLESEAVEDAVTGSLNVYLNSVKVISVMSPYVSALNPGTAANEVRIYLNSFGSITDNVETTYDDLYITDQPKRLGDSRIITLMPTSDISAQWQPDVPGDNFSRVAQPFHSLTSVASPIPHVSTTLNAQDIYTLEQLPYSPKAIHALKSMSIAGMDTSGPDGYRVSLISEADKSSGDLVHLTGSYALSQNWFPLDPHGQFWKTDSVNSTQISIEAV
jgi:hypothetical protein